MKRKAKELQRQRQDAMKYGRNTSGYSGISGGGSGNGGRQDTQIVESVSVDNPKPSSYAATVPSRSVIVLHSCHIRLTVLVVSVSTKCQNTILDKKILTFIYQLSFISDRVHQCDFR